VKNTIDLFRLDGRIALVTGGAGNVGRPIVRGLAEAGATVVLASRNEAKCKAYAAELAGEGLQVQGEKCDLASESDIRSLCDRILERHGRLDILFNNSLVRAGGDLRHTTAAEWEVSMRVNATGLFLACQIFSEPMQAQRSGSIVNIGSIYGMVGPDFSLYEGTRLANRVDYAFAKGGMLNLTRYLASYLAQWNVRVNCVSLGGVATTDLPASFIANYTRKTLLDRMADAVDIQGPAVFLASDASRYITGANIPVDGGWTAI
jgi:NAD(P)-dependent dehydrogenase (short-subunit alcohol dehydrogenase family)